MVTPAGVESWLHSGLSANTQCAFQVSAANADGESNQTPNFSRYTLAATPDAPTVSNPTPSTLNVAIGAGDGNPAHTGYYIQISPAVGGNVWVQGDGALGASPVYQTAAAWGTVTVSDLMEETQHSFTVTARNSSPLSFFACERIERY